MNHLGTLRFDASRTAPPLRMLMRRLLSPLAAYIDVSAGYAEAMGGVNPRARVLEIVKSGGAVA